MIRDAIVVCEMFDLLGKEGSVDSIDCLIYCGGECSDINRQAVIESVHHRGEW